MMKHKHLFFVSLFSLMLISNQTKAFWPVFDMGEIVPSIKGVVESGKQLKTVQQSLADLKKSLETLKASVASLASFAAILGFDPSAIDEFMTSINDKISENLDFDINIQEQIDNKISEITQGQLDGIESAIDEIENVAADVENLNNDVEQMADKINKDIELKVEDPRDLNAPEVIDIKEPTELKTPKNLIIEEAPFKLKFVDEEVVEEEEEEEIDDSEQLSKVKQIITLTKSEIEKSHIMLNDYLDIAINKLSENHKITSNQIDEIQKRVNGSADIADDKKTQLSEELEIIKEDNNQLYSKMIASAESKKYSYNREYKSKIEEGFNNYEKIVEAYIYGDISKDRFLNGGKEFKKKANSVVLVLKGNNNQEFLLASTTIKDKLKEVSNKITSLSGNSKVN